MNKTNNRNNSITDDIKITKFIPPKVYPVNVKVAQYTIQNKQLLNIINAKNGQKFVSSTFNIGKSTWGMYIWPNGASAKTVGFFQVYLRLVSMPSSWKSVEFITGTTVIAHTISSHKCTHTFTAAGIWGWPSNTLPLSQLQSDTVNNIELFLSVRILNITLKNGNNYYAFQAPWKSTIKIESNMKKSIMNYLKKSHPGNSYYCGWGPHRAWGSFIYPNRTEAAAGECLLGVKLFRWPKNISKVKIQWTVSLPSHQYKKTFNSVVTRAQPCGTILMPMTFDEFKKLDSLKIIVDIVVLSVLDAKGKDIKNQICNRNPGKLFKKYDESVINQLTKFGYSREDCISASLLVSDAKDVNAVMNKVLDIQNNRQAKNVRYVEEEEKKTAVIPIFKPFKKFNRVYEEKGTEIEIPIKQIAASVIQTVSAFASHGLLASRLSKQITDFVEKAGWSNSTTKSHVSEHFYMNDTYVFVGMERSVQVNKIGFGIKKSEIRIIAKTKFVYAEAKNNAARLKLEKLISDEANDAFEYICKNKDFKWTTEL